MSSGGVVKALVESWWKSYISGRSLKSERWEHCHRQFHNVTSNLAVLALSKLVRSVSQSVSQLSSCPIFIISLWKGCVHMQASKQARLFMYISLVTCTPFTSHPSTSLSAITALSLPSRLFAIPTYSYGTTVWRVTGGGGAFGAVTPGQQSDDDTRGKTNQTDDEDWVGGTASKRFGTIGVQ